jgi:N-methylhydantoinase A/oxoprolinase/acetone carboxylase beta subunit
VRDWSSVVRSRLIALGIEAEREEQIRAELAGHLDGLAAGTAAVPAAKKHRAAYFAEAAGYVDTPVYDRYQLDPGARLAGPVIVEERESTTVIGPGARVSVDTHRNLVAEPAGEVR